MPHFVKEVTSLKVEEGDCAILQAKYDPKTADVKWFREDVQIQDCIDFRIFSKSKFSKKIIRGFTFFSSV